MLELILDKQILFILMGVFAALGVLSKCIANVTLKKLVRAAGNMGKSTHPLMRLVRAKFEHACMVSDKVQNVGVFVEKYMYEYKAAGLKLHTWRRVEKGMCWVCLILGFAAAALEYYVHGMGDRVLFNGAAGAVVAIFLFLFLLTTDEEYQFEAAKNYMVDYLENVCAHRYGKAVPKELKVMPAAEAMAPEMKTPEIQQPERPRPREEVPSPGYDPEIKPPAMPQQPEPAKPEIVGAATSESRKTSAKKTAKKALAKETPVKEEKAKPEEGRDADEISREVRIREILEEFLA